MEPVKEGSLYRMKVFKLGYAEFNTKDVKALTDYYTNVMGFSLIEEADNGKSYISSGVDHHNIVVAPSDVSHLNKVGWQVGGEMTLQEVGKQLKEHGISSELKTDAEPGISELLELQDPSGTIVNLYKEIDMPTPGFREAGIVPNKLGHIAIGVKNAKETVDFYKQVLGFWETDKIGDIANFLTCNSDHHTLNILQSKRQVMHHIAFELRSFEHHKDSSDKLSKYGLPILWGPSRHTAGHNIASYHHDPDQHFIELFSDLDVYIPELDYMDPRPWHENLPQRPRVWESLSYWGTDFNHDLVGIVMQEEEVKK